MAKLRNPIFSLDGSGQIGQATVLRSSRGQTIFESKPIPRYTKTLPQAYQRWLYEDHTAYWHQQSQATQQQWRSNASRYHMTGFAYWMSYHLKNLPDIIGLWHLDYTSGGLTPDSSRNLLNLTVFGASPSTGIIDQSLYFDGINDYLSHADTPPLNPQDHVSVEVFCRPHAFNVWWHPYLVIKTGSYSLFLNRTFNYRCCFVIDATANWVLSTIPPPLNTWSHFCATYDRTLPADNMVMYTNGDIEDTHNYNAQLPVTPNAFFVGNRPDLQRPFEGELDMIIIYNRTLTPSDVKRHSERRYP